MAQLSHSGHLARQSLKHLPQLLLIYRDRLLTLLSIPIMVVVITTIHDVITIFSRGCQFLYLPDLVKHLSLHFAELPPQRLVTQRDRLGATRVFPLLVLARTTQMMKPPLFIGAVRWQVETRAGKQRQRARLVGLAPHHPSSLI